jgi:thiol-disulfide isomerase/thioredoxin
LVVLALLVACDETAVPLKVNVGQTVPALPVQNLRNQSVVLTPSSEKVLIINVWATWCPPPCRAEMPSLQTLAERLGGEHFKLVGLSVDKDEHLVREYLIENALHFPSFLDRNFHVVNGILGLRVFPSTFFIAPDGTLLSVIEGERDWNEPELFARIKDFAGA